MKTLKVGIASYEVMKARTLAIAKGELKPKASEPKVRFTSPESFAKLLSNRNRALLSVIAETRPSSLHELAAHTGRTPGNLSRTLRAMEHYGLVRLHKGARRSALSRCQTRNELVLTTKLSLCKASEPEPNGGRGDMRTMSTAQTTQR